VVGARVLAVAGCWCLLSAALQASTRLTALTAMVMQQRCQVAFVSSAIV
jgi:hypothetical protein